MTWIKYQVHINYNECYFFSGLFHTDNYILKGYNNKEATPLKTSFSNKYI